MASDLARQLIDACSDRPSVADQAGAERTVIRNGLAPVPGALAEVARRVEEDWSALSTPERVSALLFFAELLASHLDDQGSGPHQPGHTA